MRAAKVLVALSVLALGVVEAGDASACGGCFIAQGENTVVSGHRMILSVSPEESTLWDQIVYAGEPSSFAWVLPVRGVVEVGLSSDALFQTLEQLTQVSISSPQINCNPPSCSGASSTGGFNGSGGGGGGGGGVTVIAQETVGPYETVQLQSADPDALQNWLLSHGYNVPPDIAPVVNAYVAEGFNFLALKLVPGQGVDSMRPVRISTTGASAALPLRMVAAGTGAVTPITLWVMGEGRYEPLNFPSFEILEEQLVWSWEEQRSNYAQLKQAAFTATGGAGWLIEAGEPTSPYNIEYPLLDLVNWSPTESGYGDPDGAGAEIELHDDLQKLYGGIPDNALWVNRLHGELSRQALIDDLDLTASASQTPVRRFFQTTETVGDAPECPPQPPCDDFNPPDSGNPWDGIFGHHPGGSSSGGSCAMEAGGGAPALAGLALAAALALSRRRRR